MISSEVSHYCVSLLVCWPMQCIKFVITAKCNWQHMRSWQPFCCNTPNHVKILGMRKKRLQRWQRAQTVSSKQELPAGFCTRMTLADCTCSKQRPLYAHTANQPIHHLHIPRSCASEFIFYTHHCGQAGALAPSKPACALPPAKRCEAPPISLPHPGQLACCIGPPHSPMAYT